jgi:hypothetical protein
MKDEFTSSEADEIRSRLVLDESFEEYARISRKGDNIYYLGKVASEQSVLLIPVEGEYYIADIMGQFDFFALNNLVKTLSSESDQEKFLDIFQLMGGRRETGGEQNIQMDSTTISDPEKTPDADTIINN